MKSTFTTFFFLLLVIPESTYPQEIVTIWGDTRGWPAGEYVILWEGTGSFRLFGSFSNQTTTGPHRMTFDLVPQEQGIVELAIENSDINDPIRNIRVTGGKPTTGARNREKDGTTPTNSPGPNAPRWIITPGPTKRAFPTK